MRSLPSPGKEDTASHDILAGADSQRNGDTGQKGLSDEQKEECYVLMESHVV